MRLWYVWFKSYGRNVWEHRVTHSEREARDLENHLWGYGSVEFVQVREGSHD